MTSGRPRLPAAERRTARVDVDLSPVELAELRTRAATAHMGVRAYVRRRALGGRVVVPPPLANMQAWLDLARAAANLNQVARAINAGQVIAVGRDIYALLHQMHSSVQELRDILIGADPAKITDDNGDEAENN